MDVLTLQIRARTLSREQFIAATPGLYLAVTPLSEGGPISFRTGEIDIEARPPPSSPTELEVLALEKAPVNPYPDRISIGRARNCDVVLRFASVSKLHAHVRQIGEAVVELIDLDSQNGTSVNGRRLAPNEPERVLVGDLLMFGGISVQLTDAGRLYDLLQRTTGT